MKRFLLLIIVVLPFCNIYAQAPKPNSKYPFAASDDWVQSKNYYLLTLFEQNKAVNALLANDAELAKLTHKKLEDLSASLACKDASCFIENIKITDSEIKAVSNRLIQLYRANNALGRLVKTQLIPSGTYSLLNKNITPAQLLAQAWEQDAEGINYTIDVYAGGKKPNYPLIDSISWNTKAKKYKTLLYDCAATLQGDVKRSKLFFEPSMHAALLYLEINERHDPANYEPMAQTVNKAAVDHIKAVKWSKYPYTVILIPGAGPDDLVTPLSAEGMLRCRLAVQQYRDGKAPFIMPSGGKVHPYKTKYCEAEEMKKYMIKVLHIPAYVIIMEPHARHTTTNMRNGARLMLRYNIPANKPGLVVTEKSQAGAILLMAGRCMKELGYVPYKLGKTLSDTAEEFYPLPESLQINPYEPLDP